MEEYLIFIAIAPLLIVMFVAFIVIKFRTDPVVREIKKQNDLKPVVIKTWMTMEKEYDRLKAKGYFDE